VWSTACRRTTFQGVEKKELRKLPGELAHEAAFTEPNLGSHIDDSPGDKTSQLDAGVGGRKFDKLIL
jgi:hypothetical protein